MNLALFDFDGTLTTADAFTAFIRFAVPPWRLKIGHVLLLPAVLAYRAKVLPARRLRRLIVWLGFLGAPVDRSMRRGEIFAVSSLPATVRPEMLARLRDHQERGDRVVIVSASLDLYLSHWCAAQGVELICSKLATAGGRFTGCYLDGDCTGEEKARRISVAYDLAAYDEIFAYGDTPEDYPMLALAARRFFRGTELSPRAWRALLAV